MLHIATLLPSPSGVTVTDSASLWHRIVRPFLQSLGYGPDLCVKQSVPDESSGEAGEPLHMLLFHAAPESEVAPDLLMVIEARRVVPGEVLERALSLMATMPMPPPLVALVYRQRSGFVLTAYHGTTRVPLGVAFPSPAALKSLATGLRRVTAIQQNRRTASGEVAMALSQARLNGDTPQVTLLLADLAAELQLEGRYPEADEALIELLEIRRSEGSELEVARGLKELGQVRFLQEQWDDAESMLLQALEVFRTSGERLAMAATLVDLGGVHLSRRSYDAASIFLQEGLAIYRALNDVPGEAATLNNLAHVHVAAGDPQSAAHCLEQSLEVTRALGETREELITLYNLAAIYQMLGRDSLAQRMIREVRQLSEALNDPEA